MNSNLEKITKMVDSGIPTADIIKELEKMYGAIDSDTIRTITNFLNKRTFGGKS